MQFFNISTCIIPATLFAISGIVQQHQRLSPVVLRRDVALGRAHVDARLVHASVAELHLEGLVTPRKRYGGGDGGGRDGGTKTVTTRESDISLNSIEVMGC